MKSQYGSSLRFSHRLVRLAHDWQISNVDRMRVPRVLGVAYELSRNIFKEPMRDEVFLHMHLDISHFLDEQ